MAATTQSVPRLRAKIIYAFVQDDCSYCHQAKKQLDAFAKKHSDVLVQYHNVTRGERYVQGFTAEATPTILFSVGGKIQDKLTAQEPLKLKELERRMAVALEAP
jgi:hypothetical protein